jgi:uncharacterized membrane protein
MPPWMNESTPSGADRVVGGLCYLTMGLAGLLYIIIGGKRGQSSFFRFHFLQSIVLGIISLLLSWSSNVFIMFISSIAGMFGADLAPTIVGWVGFAVDIVSKVGLLLLVYGMIWAFLGKYAEIPFISNIVRQQMRL